MTARRDSKDTGLAGLDSRNESHATGINLRESRCECAALQRSARPRGSEDPAFATRLLDSRFRGNERMRRCIDLKPDGLFENQPARVPMRLISHSSSTPEDSFTRFRTVSPSVSISAAVAPPRLIRKLQCSSETCALPTFRPRQPTASISSQALAPDGFLNVDPPVRLLIGCVAS